MTLALARFMGDENATISNMWVNKKPICFGLEDGHRDVKVADETRIPAGTYKIKLRDVGGMTKKYEEKFEKGFHKGMLWLQDVPGFEWIYIHAGNTDKHTSGCILVGRGADLEEDGKQLYNSIEKYKELYTLVSDAILKGEEVTITILDEMARV